MHPKTHRGAVLSLIAGIALLFFPKALLAQTDILSMTGAGAAGLFEIHSKVMEAHYKANYLIVAEKIIQPVDFRQGKYRYRTILKSAKGTPISFRSFKKGQWVFVRGVALSDSTIAAREIYRLPGFVDPKDYGSYPFFENIPAWKPTVVK